MLEIRVLLLTRPRSVVLGVSRDPGRLVPWFQRFWFPRPGLWFRVVVPGRHVDRLTLNGSTVLDRLGSLVPWSWIVLVLWFYV